MWTIVKCWNVTNLMPDAAMLKEACPLMSWSLTSVTVAGRCRAGRRYGLLREVLFVKKDGSDILRHGVKHHFYNSFGRSDIVCHKPFPCHSDTAIAVKADTYLSTKYSCIYCHRGFCEVSS